MSKIIKKGRVLRRLGVNLWGDSNASINTRNSRPGVHGSKRVRVSEYGVKLTEKQKVRTYYGMQEKQFKRFFHNAKKQKGNTATHFLQMLECRLQTFVYRMKWGSMFAARQLISHGHILVNGKRVDIRSYLLKENDIVSLSENAQQMNIIKKHIEVSPKKVPAYIEVSSDFEGKLLREPEASEIQHEVPLNSQAVVELYSR